MDIPDTLYNDLRFLEVARMLRERKRQVEEALLSDDEIADDEVTRRVQATINLGMKHRNTKYQ
jgi:hypothetical protein